DLGTAALLGISGLIFLRWDTPRLLQTPVFWIGLGLGLLPAIAWWGQYDWHQGGLTDLFALADGAKHRGWWWIGASFPGIIFALTGLQQARQGQQWSWARFLICQGGVYSLLVMLSPWSSAPLVIPLFAPLALAAAISLTDAYPPTHWVYPAWWRHSFLISAGGLFLALTWVYWQSISQSSVMGYAVPDHPEQLWGLLLLALLAMTMMMTATLLAQQKSEFIAVLFWGLFVCLVLAIHSPLWPAFLGEIDKLSAPYP
ncbi:MAG: glycosyltransferase family 39 protein, partial [Synechocystis sp.]|nr:glycosyltransferase family 39 protein [Synechocystis sp.]